MSSLIDKFNRYHGTYSRSGIQNLFVFVGCIIQAKTVNLYNLRDEVGKITGKYKSKTDSHYKRLTRFLVLFSAGGLWASILEFSLSLLSTEFKIAYLDATEWSIGTFKVHILVLAIDCQGIAIPLYFQIYAHKGVLSELERIAFLRNAAHFVCLKDKIIVADREFIGNQWFGEFNDLGIEFVVRIRKGMYKNNLMANRNYDLLQKRALKKGQASMLIKVDVHQFRLFIVKNSQQKNPKEPLVYILTNMLNKANTPPLYQFRWRIESLFKHLKTNGYNLEDLRIINLDKIRLMMAMLILAYTLATLTAMEERKKNPVKTKTYQNQKEYDTVSIFKQGQSLLKQSFISLTRFLDIIQYLNVLIKAPLHFDKAFVQ